LLTADTSYGAEVEKLLNLHIETHLASYLHTIPTDPLPLLHPWRAHHPGDPTSAK
jgi:hypothetical protein